MIVLVLIFLAFAAFVGLLMEIYKKSIRKDKASVWEIRGVAFALSAIFGTVAWLITDAHMLAEMLKDTPWNIIPFTVIVYLLQLPACMSVWKPILKRIAEKKAE